MLKHLKITGYAWVEVEDENENEDVEFGYIDQILDTLEIEEIEDLGVSED